MIFWFLTIMSVIFGVVIVVMALVFVVKYRRRDESYIPTPVHGNTKMELGWIFGLTLLAIMTFFWAATVYVQNYDAPVGQLELRWQILENTRLSIGYDREEDERRGLKTVPITGSSEHIVVVPKDFSL